MEENEFDKYCLYCILFSYFDVITVNDDDSSLDYKDLVLTGRDIIKSALQAFEYQQLKDAATLQEFENQQLKDAAR